jgi:hypothetical protein
MICGAIEHDIELTWVSRTINAALVQAIHKAASYHVSIVIDCLRRYCQAMTGIDAPGTSRAYLPVCCEIWGIGTHGDGDADGHISLAKVAIGNIDIVLHRDGERPNDFGSPLYDDLRPMAMNRYPRLINAMRVDFVSRLCLPKRFN